MSVPGKMHSFFVPGISLIGVGACHGIPHYVHTYHITKPLIVTDKGIVNTGILKIITDILDGDNIPYSIYDKTVPNPTDENVTEGVAQYKADGCDGLISIGGGSSHDCCKGIGILLSNGGAIYQYEGVDKVNHMLPHYIAINTTAGTASELTRFCVITDKERHVKMSIVDWFLTPNVAVNDPVLMVGMPPSLTTATGMDALTHAIEAYVSTNTTPMTDACAEQSIRLVSKYLRKAVANGKDMEAREGMAYAQYLAGMAFNNAGLGYVHAMAHQLGGFYSLPHGECNAILLPHVESFNLISRLDRFVRIAQMMGECTDGLSERAAAELAISAIKTLSKDVGIPTTITELAARYVKAIDPRDIPAMVGHAQKDTCAATNPRTMSLEIISQLYKDVF